MLRQSLNTFARHGVFELVVAGTNPAGPTSGGP